MLGRRRHMRFSILKSEGMITVPRDVVVHSAVPGEFVVLDAEPRAVHDVLTIQTVSDGEPMAVPVKVIASRPVIQSGAVLHELLLRTHEESR